MRIRDWSSDVCSSDLGGEQQVGDALAHLDVARGHRSGRTRRETTIVRRADMDRPRDAVVRRHVVVERRTQHEERRRERKSVVWGKSESLSEDIGCRSNIKKTKRPNDDER